MLLSPAWKLDMIATRIARSTLCGGYPMPDASKASPYETFRDVFQAVGDVAPERILLDPPPGKGTEQDVLNLHARTERLYELVDGILVEKLMGLKESVVALTLGRVLGNFVEEHDLGMVAGEAGMMLLTAGLVRIPDLSFISWRQLPDRVCPEEPIPHLAPDLAVEVLSEGNTPEEMDRKLKDYFFNGVRLVWFLDPKTRARPPCTLPRTSRRSSPRKSPWTVWMSCPA